MTAKRDIVSQKSDLRKTMRRRRDNLKLLNPNPNLHLAFPSYDKSWSVAAGYAPIGSEINIWPLLTSLQKSGIRITLPVTPADNQPLTFREWTPVSQMRKDRFGVLYPQSGYYLSPQLIFVPLLAFTSTGERLGYGGGFYDRTLEKLRNSGEIFACGVAYAGQEVAILPTDAHDAKLDGILTEDGFKAFA